MTYTAIVDNLDPKAPCKCGGCAEISLYETLRPIHDCSLKPGEASPAGRCPDCGALCYVIENIGARTTRSLAAFEALIVELTNAKLLDDGVDGNPDQKNAVPARRRVLLELVERAQGMLDRGARAMAAVVAKGNTRDLAMVLAIAFGEQGLPYVITVRPQVRADDAIEILFVSGKEPLKAIRFGCDEDGGSLMVGETPPYHSILDITLAECTSLVAAHRIATVFRDHVAGGSKADPTAQAMETRPEPGEVAEYRVEWSIELDGNSPVGAARIARAIQLDPTSIGNVFKVSPATDPGKVILVDLDQDPPTTCET